MGDIVKMALSWGLARLSEKNTWVTWLAVGAAKAGIVIAPDFDNLLVNALLAIVAVVGYAVKGSPVFSKK